jgi:hypothetical protein
VVYFLGDMEAGLACVAIGFARGEWVLVEVGGSKIIIIIIIFFFWVWIVDAKDRVTQGF